MGFKIFFTILLFSLVFTSCKNTAEINGEIFIVTKTAENKKLGDITVTAYPYDELQKLLEQKTKEDPERKQPNSWYLSGLPKSITSAQTNSEGKFTLKVPNGVYAITAQAKISETDVLWVVRVNADKPVSVNLSNKNMALIGSSDSMLP